MIRARRRMLGVLNPRTHNYMPKAAMIIVLTAAILTVTGGSSTAARNNSQFDSSVLVVSINEAMIDNRNASSSTDCILVMPDGRFHLERRKEIAPNPTSSLSIFEASLDSTQLQQLHDILKREGIERLPDYALPVFPMAVPWFATFNAKIEQGGQTRKVGYWRWHGGTAETSPNSTPANVKKTWKESEIALRPLVEWFHAIESLKLSPSGAQPTGCDGSY